MTLEFFLISIFANFQNLGLQFPEFFCSVFNLRMGEIMYRGKPGIRLYYLYLLSNDKDALMGF